MKKKRTRTHTSLFLFPISMHNEAAQFITKVYNVCAKPAIESVLESGALFDETPSGAFEDALCIWCAGKDTSLNRRLQ